MAPLGWMLLFGALMSVIALVGGVAVMLPRATLDRVLLPLVAFAAGTLLGGALLHMLPASVEQLGNGAAVWTSAALGFLAFFCLEQFVHWHHCHRAEHDHRAPTGWLVLVGDGLHNLLGGLAIGAVFLVDVRLGVTAWLAAAAHEVPQELGDFGVLVHSGWSRKHALLWNVASALTFPVGMVIAWAASGAFDTAPLIAFGAGNFLYIAAADLVPEVKRPPSLPRAVEHLLCFAAGLLLLYWLR